MLNEYVPADTVPDMIPVVLFKLNPEGKLLPGATVYNTALVADNWKLTTPKRLVNDDCVQTGGT
jgi:hypothetical protein